MVGWSKSSSLQITPGSLQANSTRSSGLVPTAPIRSSGTSCALRSSRAASTRWSFAPRSCWKRPKATRKGSVEQQKRGLPSFQTRHELSLELVHATEAAALGCARLLGKGDPDRVSEVAGEAMRRVLEDSGMSGTVMLGPRNDPNLAHGTALAGGERVVDFG